MKNYIFLCALFCSVISAQTTLPDGLLPSLAGSIRFGQDAMELNGNPDWLAYASVPEETEYVQRIRYNVGDHLASVLLNFGKVGSFNSYELTWGKAFLVGVSLNFVSEDALSTWLLQRVPTVVLGNEVLEVSAEHSYGCALSDNLEVLMLYRLGTSLHMRVKMRP
jgi:hypothetical protein